MKWGDLKTLWDKQMKEMSEKAANEVFDKLENHNSSSLDNLLNKCINTLRIG